jgi:hypothetical protein
MRDEGSERAQTYLRLLAEAAVRAAAARPQAGADAPQHSELEMATRRAAERVSRAADILIDADVLDDREVTEVLVMLGTALRLRGVDWVTSSTRRGRPLAGAAADNADNAAAPPWLVIPGQAAGTPAGQPARSRVMALIMTAGWVIAPAVLRFPEPGPGGPAAPTFADLTATDDAGTQYMVSFTDGTWTNGTWTGTLRLRPAPPGDARILTITSSNGPVLRVPLTPAVVTGPTGALTEAGSTAAGPQDAGSAWPAGNTPAQGAPDDGGSRPEAATGPGRVTRVADSPGERLLTRWAEALLAAVAEDGHADLTAMATPANQGRYPERAAVIETLEAAGALSPLSAVPVLLSALLERAGAAGASGSAPPPLPARWSSVLAYYARRRHSPLAPGAPSAGLGAIGVILPAVDGARLVIAGVHATSEQTLLHVVARGMREMSRASSGSPASRLLTGAHDTGLSWWVRDEAGTWHLGVVHAWHPASEDTVLRMSLLPPLRPGAPGTSSTLTVEVTGTRQQLTASVRVHW